MKRLTNFQRYSGMVLYAVKVMEVATAQGLTAYVSCDVTTARRVADRLVEQGKLTKRVKRFWNGMNYANRNYYELPKE